MFTTFPTKPIPHSPKLLHYPSNRNIHRSAVIYEPNVNILPARPQDVRIQPERPIPVIQLPGLPPRSLPKSIMKPLAKDWSEAPRKSVSNESHSSLELIFSNSWLAQFRPFKKLRDLPPPTYTPKSATFVNGSKSHKDLADFDDTLEAGSYDFKPTPPPLYTKHPPEGGVVGWLTVAAA